MIKNIWKNVDVVCGNHKDNHKIRLVPTQGKDSMFYACPKYRQENRESDERACPNRITLKDYEAMINHISELIEKNGGFINLAYWEGYKGNSRIYVNTDRGSVYYSIKEKIWKDKNLRMEEYDMEDIRKQAFAIAGVSNETEFAKYRC